MTRSTLKTTAAILLFSLFSAVALSQDSIPSLNAKPRNPANFWRRVTVGGNLGFQFGSVTGITISPEVRIRTIDQLHVGFRFTYQYIYDKTYFWNKTNGDYLAYKSNVFGGSIYLRFYLSSFFENFLGNLFAHIEYEYLVYQRPYVQSSTGNIQGADGNLYMPGNEVIRFNSFFVGGGFRQPISNRVAMDFLLLFNINDTYNSPYSNPIFRLGVGVGL